MKIDQRYLSIQRKPEIGSSNIRFEILTFASINSLGVDDFHNFHDRKFRLRIVELKQFKKSYRPYNSEDEIAY